MKPIDPDDWEPSKGIKLDALTLAAVKERTSAAIVAGPGAGKTELLAQRASFLLQTNRCPDPRRILAISFKRDAANNLRGRVLARVGTELAGRLESYTFDAFAKGLVGRFSSALPAWCRPSRNYRVVFPRAADWRAFANDLPYNVNGQQLERAHTRIGAAGPLPLDRPTPQAELDRSAVEWWEWSIGREPSELTFGMISTLASTILRHNPMIANALRRTFSHVFLDEFQDTTGLQYQLVTEAFRGTPTVITAVGDTKQRIMTWAGALPGNFQSFVAEFDAADHRLAANFRSNHRIVEIVNAMARELEPEAVHIVCARPDDALPNPSDGVYEFASAVTEAEMLAAWIAGEVALAERRPEDFLLLVRQQADRAEAPLSEAFARHGLVLRNEARVVAGVAIQELMTEPLSDLVIVMIQMAVGDRSDRPFQRVWDILSGPFGLDVDRPEPQLRLEQAIREITALARDVVSELEPGVTDMAGLVAAILEPLGTRIVMQLAPEYENEERLAVTSKAVAAFLAECAEAATTWHDLVAAYIGRAQVRLMTVHKSKGLEADTVVFLHLQDDGFFAHPNLEEEKLTFFVAASRARERFFVTTTSPARQNIRPLWDMVEAAGMPALEL
jgi:superfamily I DNA/RNA helicase